MLTHTIAAVILELSYLVTGVILCLLGQKLIEKGVESKTKLEGTIGGNKWMLLTSSPGIVFALSGLGIILYAIVNTTDYSESPMVATADNQQSAPSPDLAARTSVHSRLFTEEVSTSSLTSRLSMYIIQFKSQSREEKDIGQLLSAIPLNAQTESWAVTCDRLIDAIRTNPTELARFLKIPQYRWIAERDQRDGTLSALIELETERLLSQG